MFDSVRITTWLFIPFLLFLKVSSLKIKLFKNFQGCFTVQLSRFLSCFFVVSLPEQLWYYITAFSVCQQLFSTFLFLFIGAVLISEVCIRLFLCLCGVFRSDVLHNTTTFLRCQHLFLKFFKFFVFYVLYLFFIHLRLFFILHFLFSCAFLLLRFICFRHQMHKNSPHSIHFESCGEFNRVKQVPCFNCAEQ